MARKKKTSAKMEANQRAPSRTPSIPEHSRKSHPPSAPKHRNSKADEIVGKKKAHNKANLRLNRVPEDAEHELQDEALSRPQELLELSNNGPLAYHSPHDELSTQLMRRGANNIGKGRVDSRLSQTQESTSRGLSVYEPIDQDPTRDQGQPMQASMSPMAQYPPATMSRERPSGGFFEGPTNNVEIKGGIINHTLGNHTNLTIQVNPPREEHYDAPQYYPHPLPPLSPSPTPAPNHSIAPPPIQDLQGDRFTPMTVYEPSISTTIYSPDNSNKIYERHLGLKQRGFPLWIPEPNRSLPLAYRCKGVHVGDVGIITPSGAFSFLFNICLPHDDPINPRTLPDGFAPIYPPIETTDIREYQEFNPVSYLASKAIEKIHDPQFPGLSFVTSSAEGAVLTLPDGAIARDLGNIRRFRAYAAANIESWYRYVNGPRGCEAKNGEIRLVIGCDKTTSWGMVAVANITQHKTHFLNYRSVGNGEAETLPIPQYKWEYTGLAEARVGPGLQEMEDLSRNDDSEITVEGRQWNQCLFIRTLNLTLSDDVFAAINQELEAALVQESQQYRNKGNSSNSTNNPPNSNVQMGGTGVQSGTNSATQRSTTGHLTISDTARERVTTSMSPSAPKLHPADVLNRILLQKFPTSRVIITQDEDWCSVINEEDEIMPSASKIAERALATHHIREEDGVVFLEIKKELQSALRLRQISSSQTNHQHTDAFQLLNTVKPLTSGQNDIPTLPMATKKRKRVPWSITDYSEVKEVNSDNRLLEDIVIDDTPSPSSPILPSPANGTHSVSHQPSIYTAPLRSRTRATVEAETLSPSTSVPTSPAAKKRKPDYREEIRTPEAKKPVATSSRQFRTLDPATWKNQNPAAIDDISITRVGSYDDQEGNYIFVPDDVIHRRYRTIRLLGQGTFAKVIEAIDTNTNTRVAIKIVKAIPRYRDASKNEVRVLRKLGERDPTNRNNCIHLLSWFDYRNHICLVSELLGMSVYEFIKENDFAPLPRQHIQTFARQLCNTVAFVHDLQLIHTDLKPENILLAHNDYRTVQITAPGKRNALPTPKRILECTDIRLIDFGSATFEQEYHATIVSTRHYRAPEIILGLGWSFPCDAYSLGCILVEFFTGIALYQIHDDLEHLAMMEMVMGKIPEPFARAGARSKPEFFKDSKLDWPNPKTTRKSKKDVRATWPLQDIIPPTDHINQQFFDLVHKLLAFDPAERITMQEMLQHPYFLLNIPIEI